MKRSHFISLSFLFLLINIIIFKPYSFENRLLSAGNRVEICLTLVVNEICLYSCLSFFYSNYYMISNIAFTQNYCCPKKDDTSLEYECILSSSKKIYKLGETPAVNVSIKNKSGKDVYLIGCLDGSEEKWRMPFCYFYIEKPITDSLPLVARCGNMNPLRKRDFKLVASGDSFDPFSKSSGYWSSYEIKRSDHFKKIGRYKVTFHYVAKSDKLEDFLGDHGFGVRRSQNNEVIELFKQTPSIKLESNTIEIEIQNCPPAISLFNKTNPPLSKSDESNLNYADSPVVQMLSTIPKTVVS